MINESLQNEIASHIASKIDYIALSTAYDEPDNTTGLEQELVRLAVTPSRVNNTVTIAGTFPADGSTITLSTTVASVTSKKVFTVASVSGLDVAGGQRCQLTLAGNNNRAEPNKITGVSGLEITTQNEFTVLPQIGDAFELLISRINLIYDGSSTLNSGSPALVSAFYDKKTPSDTFPFNITLQVK